MLLRSGYRASSCVSSRLLLVTTPHVPYSRTVTSLCSSRSAAGINKSATFSVEKRFSLLSTVFHGYNRSPVTFATRAFSSGTCFPPAWDGGYSFSSALQACASFKFLPWVIPLRKAQYRTGPKVG